MNALRSGCEAKRRVQRDATVWCFNCGRSYFLRMLASLPTVASNKLLTLSYL